MIGLSAIEKLLQDVEIEPLSKSIPSMLPIALECKDYKGYCVLLQLITPISKNAPTNTIQTNEIIQNLLLQGLTAEVVAKIVAESKEELINLRTISVDQVSSHSIKEIETWMPEAEAILERPNNSPSDSYMGLSNRLGQMRRFYETIRGYIIAKLTYYQQVLNFTASHKSTPSQSSVKQANYNNNKVFIVHGHHGELKESLARLIEQQGIRPIILHEQANKGDTIIEKFERNSDVGCAVCLFTADDVGNAKDASEQQARARQNVVFEAGYFIGKIGRERVILLADKDVEIPSDLQGVLYIGTGDWRLNVLKELKNLGYSIDYDKL